MIMALLSSCIEDKGNYDYHEVNKVTIEGINESYSTTLGATLQITPSLTFSLGENVDEFAYQWCVMESYSPYALRGVASTERNLNIQIGGEGCPIYREGDYYILYLVENLTTKVRYYKVFTLSVQNRTTTGYALLCETANGFDIDLVSLYQDTLTQYHKVLELFQSDLPHEGIKATQLVCYSDYLSPAVVDYMDEENNTGRSKYYAMWVLSDVGTDRVRVEDFAYKTKYNIATQILRMPNSKFPAGDIVRVDKMASVASNSSSRLGRAYSYYDGNWFFYNYSPLTWYYLLPVNQYISTVESPQYKTTPYIIVGSTNGAVLFNVDRNRFEFHKAGTSEISTGSSANFYCTVELTGGTYFDWANPNYELKYMDNRTNTAGFAIVYNRATGKHEFLQINTTPTPSATQLGMSEFPTSFKTDGVLFYAYHRTLPYLYYATEDHVYRVNTSTMATIDDITSQVLPAGQKISLLKSSQQRYIRANLIGVATYTSGGQAGNNGQIAFYEAEDGTGNLILAKHPATPTDAGYQIDMRWSGFGKVIDYDYKNPL